MLTFFGAGIFGLAIFAGAVGTAAPEVMLDTLLCQDPEYAALDDAARKRARKSARVFGVFLFLVGALGLCTVLASGQVINGHGASSKKRPPMCLAGGRMMANSGQAFPATLGGVTWRGRQGHRTRAGVQRRLAAQTRQGGHLAMLTPSMQKAP